MRHQQLVVLDPVGATEGHLPEDLGALPGRHPDGRLHHHDEQGPPRRADQRPNPVEPELGALERPSERRRQVQVEEPDLPRRRAFAVDRGEQERDLRPQVMERERQLHDPVPVPRGGVDHLVVGDLPGRDDSRRVPLAQRRGLALESDPRAGRLHLGEGPDGPVDVHARGRPVRIGRHDELALVDALGQGEPVTVGHRRIGQRPASSIESSPPCSGPRGMIGQMSTTVSPSTTWYASK